MQYIPILITFILAFSMSFYAYRRGLKDGIDITKGKEIKPLRSDITKPKEHVDTLTQGIANLLSYDGTDQRKKVKE